MAPPKSILLTAGIRLSPDKTRQIGPLAACQSVEPGVRLMDLFGAEEGVAEEKVMFKFRLLVLLVLLLAWSSQGGAQFAHTEHKQIVDGGGRSGIETSKPVLVRAEHLGNWLVPEGYMWLFEGGPQSPSEILEQVLEL